MAGATVDLKSMFGDDAAQDPKWRCRARSMFFSATRSRQQTRETLEARLNDPQILQAKLDDPVKQVNEGLIAGLVLGAPEFQRR